MRLAFMGTPDFALETLKALHAVGHDIAAVYSQPPRPAGRGQQPRPSPVQAWATERGMPVRTPPSFKTASDVAAFADLDLDIAVVAAYGMLLPQAILDTPRHGCLNVHASLLPRWRGAAPIQRAILAGDTETGVTIMQMEPGLDTGPMLLRESVAIGPHTTAGALHDDLAVLGARLIAEALERLPTLEPVPQPDTGVTYADKIDKRESRIDWSTPAIDVDRRVRAFTPWPGAWFPLPDGARLRILAGEVCEDRGHDPDAPGTILDAAMTVACAEGAYRPVRVQPAGKGAMDVAAYLRGNSVPPGSVLPAV